MTTEIHEVLACPVCRGGIRAKDDLLRSLELECVHCGRMFAVRNGIPDFLREEDLAGTNQSFARFYDCASRFYRAVAPLLFLFLGGERRFRLEIIRRLKPTGRVLEVSIGAGSNLPFLADGADEIYGVDISRGQLRECRKFAQKLELSPRLYLAAAERLPFSDDVFHSVLHIAGINFFSDKRRAIEEMCRVTRRGGRVVIAAETERLVREYRWILPGFSRLFPSEREPVTVPTHFVPRGMEDLRTDLLCRRLIYCIQFRKPLAHARTDRANRNQGNVINVGMRRGRLIR